MASYLCCSALSRRHYQDHLSLPTVRKYIRNDSQEGKDLQAIKQEGDLLRAEGDIPVREPI